MGRVEENNNLILFPPQHEVITTRVIKSLPPTTVWIITQWKGFNNMQLKIVKANPIYHWFIASGHVVMRSQMMYEAKSVEINRKTFDVQLIGNPSSEESNFVFGVSSGHGSFSFQLCDWKLISIRGNCWNTKTPCQWCIGKTVE